MAAIAGWPEVHNLSLVYEHSDAEPGDAPAEAEFDFRAWRQSVGDFARGQTSRDARPSDLPASTSAARVKPSPPQRQKISAPRVKALMADTNVLIMISPSLCP